MTIFRRALWLASLSSMGALLLITLVPGVGETVGGKKVTILSTASVNGELAPCG